jgi:hypothetical protein
MNSQQNTVRGNLEKLLPAGFAAALALVLFAPTVQAQAVGATDIDITIPDIVILHYFSSVSVEIDGAEMGAFLTGTSSAAQAGSEAPVSVGPGGFTQNLNINPTGLTGNPSAAVLTLENAWAVRAISGGASTQTRVAIANTGGTLDRPAPSTASITISTVGVNDGDGGATGLTADFAVPGLVNPEFGDVQLTLDLTSATEAGAYTGGQYTLTATNI